MEKILQVESLTKFFDNFLALSNINFYLKKGEILGIIGPNGAGKTTLLNIISGLIKASSGKILFKNKNITNKKPYIISRLGIAKTSQIVKPFSKLTIFENIYIAGINGGGLGKKEAKHNTMEILKILGLVKLKDKFPDTLNLPEKKKLELARALATKPELLLLDEVFAGLSENEIESIINLLKRINYYGVSIIIVEHNIKAIIRLAKRIIVLNYGKKIAEDEPEKILKNEKVIEAFFGK